MIVSSSNKIFDEHQDDHLVLKNTGSSKLNRSFSTLIKSLIFKIFPISVIAFLSSLRMVIFQRLRDGIRKRFFSKYLKELTLSPMLLFQHAHQSRIMRLRQD